jgi:hypothetical protein
VREFDTLGFFVLNMYVRTLARRLVYRHNDTYTGISASGRPLRVVYQTLEANGYLAVQMELLPEYETKRRGE